MKPRFIQTKHSGFGEWVAEVDPKTIEKIAFALRPNYDGFFEPNILRIQELLVDLCNDLTTIDMSGRVGLDAKHAAEAFKKKGFTVINLKEEE